MTGAELIAAERERQVAAEGYSPEHDDDHTDGSIAIAAACYAQDGRRRRCAYQGQETPFDWPWEEAAWKPGDRVRDLVKAGALLAAEIDRLQRANATNQDDA